ncbi:hypothetical protein [Campylobacter sp.]|uniref:hypothetical protein n=1 Tax=Campylobacter sp. TaxID=205 RepID=UPI002A82ED3F|nr:hypothetical protein [Campylobacter sp.]MDY4444816.1 hypothetical protein [Campylobacter sp.]
MKIKLNEIYAQLEAWRAERHISVESQKEGYLVNVLEELGELSSALRDYEKIKNGEQVIKKHIAREWNENNAKWAVLKYKKVTLAEAEHEIIDALCDIGIFTINAAADIPCHLKDTEIGWEDDFCDDFCDLIREISWLAADFNIKGHYGLAHYQSSKRFNLILVQLAKICENYGFDFETAMDETIKEISSRTGAYDEASKKWIQDTSPEVRSKWYKANYELARVSND